MAAGRGGTALAKPGANGIAPARGSGLAAITADWSTALMQPETIEKALGGDLSALSSVQKSQYYLAKCAAMDLDPSTKPLDWITFQGKLACYPNALAAQQIADKRKIQIDVSEPVIENGMVKCTGRGKTRDGRVTERRAYLDIGNAKGQDLANLFMKCETKAARRVTAALTGWARQAEDVLEEGGQVLATVTEDRGFAATENPLPALAAPAPVDHQARAKQNADAFAAEWKRQGMPEDPATITDYARRVLDRPISGKTDLDRRADDMGVILSDLKDRPKALITANAAYQEVGGDPEAEDGEVMRQDMLRALGREVPTRRLCTTRELLEFADRCREQVGTATVNVDTSAEDTDDFGDEGDSDYGQMSLLDEE